MGASLLYLAAVPSVMEEMTRCGPQPLTWALRNRDSMS
jgi:hypothetical protein